MNLHRGFTLVELITILVIVGVLAATVSSRLMPNSLLQIQAGRDQLLSALVIAQQIAMAQSNGVQVFTSGSTIDIRVDSNGDGVFGAGESVSYAGTRYPLLITGGVSFSSAVVAFDRRGYTSPNSITAVKGSHSVDVTITGTGYAY